MTAMSEQPYATLEVQTMRLVKHRTPYGCTVVLKLSLMFEDLGLF